MMGREDHDAELAVRDAFRTQIEKLFDDAFHIIIHQGNPDDAARKFQDGYAQANMTKKKCLAIIGAYHKEDDHLP